MKENLFQKLLKMENLILDFRFNGYENEIIKDLELIIMK